jgi:hypothetical protein
MVFCRELVRLRTATEETYKERGPAGELYKGRSEEIEAPNFPRKSFRSAFAGYVLPLCFLNKRERPCDLVSLALSLDSAPKGPSIAEVSTQ